MMIILPSLNSNEVTKITIINTFTIKCLHEGGKVFMSAYKSIDRVTMR